MIREIDILHHIMFLSRCFDQAIYETVAVMTY